MSDSIFNISITEPFGVADSTITADSSDKPIFTLEQIINQLTTSWGGGDTSTRSWATSTISFGINTSNPTNATALGYASPIEGEDGNLVDMTSLQVATAQLSFQLWDESIPLNLVESGGAAANITLNYSSKTDDDGTYAQPYLTSDNVIAAQQIWLSSNWSTNDDSGMENGGYGFTTMIHEIGHALGLSHPGAYNGTADYETDAVFAQDDIQYTIMSYFNSGYYYYPQTPMVYDIAAIQQLYGRDTTTRTGDTVYGFNCNFVIAKSIFDFSTNTIPIFTIWDAGGSNDVLDCSGWYDNQIIDLTPGNYSSVRGLNNNIGIAFNTLIEKAIGGMGDDTLTGNSANNILDGRAGNDNFDGQQGADTMLGGLGNDSYTVSSIGDLVKELLNEGKDTVYSSITYILTDNVEDLVLVGTDAINGTGNELDNQLTGNSASNILNGEDGSDWLMGEIGEDTLNGGNGDDWLLGGMGIDILNGNNGDDSYTVDNVGDTVKELLNEGKDTVYSSITYTLTDNVEDLVLIGTEAIIGTGNELDNQITGNGMNNILIGLAGDDSLDGQQGADTMLGGLGNDRYTVNSISDLVNELISEGKDTVYSSITYILTDNVEDLVLVGGDAINGTGNGLDNQLIGNSASNILDGQAGADTMEGGLGNDSYAVDNVGDLVKELLNEGKDTVYSSITYILTDHVEDLVLIGTEAINGTGNVLDNQIIGNVADNILTGLLGDDSLDGLQGADTLLGGLGNDRYTVDNVGDLVSELINEGKDTVYSSITYTLTDHVEDLVLTGTEAINGTGNVLDNYITGNVANNVLKGLCGNDTLDGQQGADTMIGGKGNDSYYVDDVDDVVHEHSHRGADTVYSTITYTLTPHVENLVLIGTEAINGTGNWLDNHLAGNSANNVLNGLDGDDTLDGALGADTLKGGEGNDSYYVDDVGDVVHEHSYRGEDTVYSVISYTLTDPVENLVLIGTNAMTGKGNALHNHLTGNGVGSILDGQAGNDSYFVDKAGDIIAESFHNGWDSVISSIDYTLEDNLEQLYLIGTANLNGTGNTQNNHLDGNASNNILDGQAGADTMEGGLGNDSYYVDNTGDQVKEQYNEGTDVVYSSVSYQLANNVETMILIGTSAINSTGNWLDNHLTGNIANNVLNGLDGDDTLDGLLGVDTMRGGVGNDRYYVDNAGDVIKEYKHEGEDTVYTNVSYTLTDHVDNIVVIGTNAITAKGNALHNHLTGNGAGSLLDGQGGDDSYYISQTGDIITESSHNGWDTVISSIDYTLENNLEQLYLTGTANLNATGNAQNNNLKGNEGDNILDGGLGKDWMAGRAGNDSYYVDNAGDKIEEQDNEGIDTVYTSVSYTLANHVENLVLTGTSAINGTGSGLNNHLMGNTANNILRAGDGNDIVIGGEGADLLIGERGQDTYYLEELTSTTDTVRISRGDSLISHYDVVNGFQLGNSSVSTIGVDRLDLDNSRIAHDTIKDGINAGLIHSHNINSGIINFGDENLYQNPLALTKTNLNDVFEYLQTNIKSNNTVAFVCENSTFVFQDNGTNDSLVELVGITAQSLSNSMTSNSVWIV